MPVYCRPLRSASLLSRDPFLLSSPKTYLGLANTDHAMRPNAPNRTTDDAATEQAQTGRYTQPCRLCRCEVRGRLRVVKELLASRYLIINQILDDCAAGNDAITFASAGSPVKRYGS